MLVTVLLSLATLAAIVGAFAGLLYPSRCKALEKHLDSSTPDYAEDKDGHGAWYKKRWSLESKRTRTGLWVICAYAVGMASLVPVQAILKTTGLDNFPMVLMIVLSVALALVGLRSMIHNSREFELDLKRRYPFGRQ